MRVAISLFVLTITIISFTRCNSVKNKEIQQNSSENTIFKVDTAFCNDMDLPLIEFTLAYPKGLTTDSAESGYENFNYISFFKTNENEVQTERISLSYYIPRSSSLIEENLREEILNQVLVIYQQLFELTDTKIEEIVFDNKKYFMLRAKGRAINPAADAVFTGTYFIQTLLLEPQENAENGLLISLLANEESEIKSFEDFSSKGYIGTVWKTLSIK